MESAATGAPAPLRAGEELDEEFTGLADEQGMMSIIGFGSLLSERSARTTFPDLQNFRIAKVRGWRRVFAHTAAIFFERGIARTETGEISSLSCEPCEGQEIVTSLFEVPSSKEAVAAFIEREHEFRLVAIRPLQLDGAPTGRTAVICAAYTDEEYRRRRCPPAEWERRYRRFGVDRVWRNDVLPCRLYLRHCVLAAQCLGDEAYNSFLDHTFLADRTTTIRHHLENHSDIMMETPPESLALRYNG